MPHGKLTVIVESATAIRGKRDSYCTLQCGSQIFSTEAAEGGGSDPVFHTEFEFEIDSSTNELAISVYSIEGPMKDDKLVGYALLNFKEIFYHGHTVPLTAYSLSRSSGKAGGFINLSLIFQARPSPKNAHVPMRQYSAPPHAAPQYPQTVRSQQNPLRQSYPTGTEDGYGSSGSEGSRSSRGSNKEFRESVDYKRSQSEPLPRPSPLAPSGPSLGPRRPVMQGGPHVARPHQPIPCRPQPNFANPYPQQQPPRMANPRVQVYHRQQQGPPVRPQPQPPVRPQQPQPPVRSQQPAQQHQHHHGFAEEVAKAVAVQATKTVLGGLFNELFQDSSS